jgi:glucose/arabinose dehydrogenase
LAALPNGDLLVGTENSTVYIIPNAEADGATGAPKVFFTSTDSIAQSVAYGPNGAVYVATEHGVWKLAYQDGDQSEPASAATEIAQVRTGQIAPNSDGDVHTSSSVAVTPTTVYVGVGSSCNACVEVDPTRATIQQMGLNGENMTTLATRIRNAIALTINPATNTLWAGGAGQDSLPAGHPYEFMDAVTLQPGALPHDYGWPACEENDHAYQAGADCSNVAVPALEFPAYATHIGATFYPANPTGPYAFPAAYRGGLFIANHGSWHSNPSTPPVVAFVTMNGDLPATPVNWNDPTVQWTTFMGGFGTSSSTSYVGRPTGLAVGPKGSLFIADDQNGAVYRIRPSP